MLFPERAQRTYDWFQKRKREIEQRAKNNNGQLTRQDRWTLEYYRYPYLLLETDDAIKERFVDVFTNGMTIDSGGKVTVTPMMANDGRLSIMFGELLEETGWRGILTDDVAANAREQIMACFEGGVPLGVRMFGDRTHVEDKWLVKHSKRKHIDEMYKYGRIRIAPASEYASGSYIKAVKDLETARRFKVPKLHDVLDGRTEVFFQGKMIPIRNGVIPVEFMMSDYYLFSTCREIDRRMPTDFKADAALIIKDRTAFVQLLRNALLHTQPAWEFLEGEAYYYDPYRDMAHDMNLEFWKHFSFAYQKEHRCVFRPRPSLSTWVKLPPFFVELGSLEHMAEVVVAK
jgi:hypothetical protein